MNNSKIKSQLERVKYNPHSIRDIDNPCVEVQLEAIKQNKFLITFIKNPCEEVLTYLYGELTNIKRNKDIFNRTHFLLIFLFLDDIIVFMNVSFIKKVENED